MRSTAVALMQRPFPAGLAARLIAPAARPLLTAMRSESGDFTAFHYDSEGLLIALERDGSGYHVACDHLGSPRVVSDASGAIVKGVEYDAFGDLISDSNPSFPAVFMVSPRASSTSARARLRPRRGPLDGAVPGNG